MQLQWLPLKLKAVDTVGEKSLARFPPSSHFNEFVFHKFVFQTFWQFWGTNMETLFFFFF